MNMKNVLCTPILIVKLFKEADACYQKNTMQRTVKLETDLSQYNILGKHELLQHAFRRTSAGPSGESGSLAC